MELSIVELLVVNTQSLDCTPAFAVFQKGLDYIIILKKLRSPALRFKGISPTVSLQSYSYCGISPLFQDSRLTIILIIIKISHRIIICVFIYINLTNKFIIMF